MNSTAVIVWNDMGKPDEHRISNQAEIHMAHFKREMQSCRWKLMSGQEKLGAAFEEKRRLDKEIYQSAQRGLYKKYSPIAKHNVSCSWWEPIIRMKVFAFFDELEAELCKLYPPPRPKLIKRKRVSLIEKVRANKS